MIKDTIGFLRTGAATGGLYQDKWTRLRLSNTQNTTRLKG
uniref:Uncharacterized protein n=1 Tax=Anguilla anguilla TaxID=7936 RepID=A0A0E9VPB6_ANGAN